MMRDTDMARHRQAIGDVLRAFNAAADNPFILKGGTALMECYGLDRFSEDIDLDCERANVPAARFFRIVDEACRRHGYSWRKGKDTATVQRAFVDYGNESSPLRVEASHRVRHVDRAKTAMVNGIRVYTISELCVLKSFAYVSRDKLRDLFDLTYIAQRYYDELSDAARDALQRALEYKDLEQFDYLVRTQSDPLIDPDLLADRFLRTMDQAGLLRDDTGAPGQDDNHNPAPSSSPAPPLPLPTPATDTSPGMAPSGGLRL